MVIFGEARSDWRIDDEVIDAPNDVLSVIFARREWEDKSHVGVYLARKLWTWFAYPPPEPDLKGLFNVMADAFENSGFELKQMLREMLNADEFYSHLMEGEDLPDSALGKLLTRLGLLDENTRTDMLPPLPLGALGSLFPKPQRCYLQFGEPVDTSEYRGRKPGKKQLQSIRRQVAGQIEEMLSELLVLREQQRGSDSLLRRLLQA